MTQKRQAGRRVGAPASDVWHPDIATDDVPVFSAEQHVGTALRETFRAFADALGDNLARLGLSLNMWFVLRALWEADGQTQVELARRLAVTPAAVVGLVNALEREGHVTRERAEDDRRAFRVRLTPAGRKLRTKATSQALQVDARALRGLGVDDVEVLLGLLSRLRQNIARN